MGANSFLVELTLFSEGALFAGKQIGSHKSCRPCKMAEYLPSVYIQSPSRDNPMLYFRVCMYVCKQGIFTCMQSYVYTECHINARSCKMKKISIRLINNMFLIYLNEPY